MSMVFALLSSHYVLVQNTGKKYIQSIIRYITVVYADQDFEIYH